VFLLVREAVTIKEKDKRQKRNEGKPDGPENQELEPTK